MKKELSITFDEPWFPEENTVSGILQRMDIGEQISLSKLKEACKREGREFKIEFT